MRTWFGDANPDISALELRARQVKSLFQPFDTAKLDVAEALGLSVQLVLDNADVGDLAAAEKVVYVTLGGVERQIAQVGGIRGLRGEGQLLADCETTVGCGQTLAHALRGCRAVTHQSWRRGQHQSRRRSHRRVGRLRSRRGQHLARCEHTEGRHFRDACNVRGDSVTCSACDS